MTSKELTGRSAALLLIALVFADITAAFETTMVFSALKSLIEEYGRPATVAWLLTAYTLMGAASAAICGRLGDIYGRRSMLLVVLLLAGTGSVISAVSPNLEGVILGRFLQGISGSILPLTLGLARQHLAAKLRPIGIAIVSSSSAAGAGLGMLVGGLLIDNIGWRAIFWASGAFLIMSLLSVVAWAPSSKRVSSDQRLDLMGGLLFVPAIAGVLLAISSGRTWDWDMRFWGLLAAACALLAFWARHELRHPNPLIEVRLLTDRRIALPNLAMALCALGAFQFPPLSLLLLQQPIWTGVGLGLSATVAGLLNLPGNFIAAAVSPISGWLCGRFGGARLIMGGMIIAALQIGLLLIYPSNLWLMAIAAITTGVGTAAVYVAVPALLVEVAPPGRTSETIGMYSVIRSLSMAVGTQSMLALLASSTVSKTGHPSAAFPSLAAYQITLEFMGGACVACVIAALFIVGVHAPARAPGPDVHG